MYPVPILATPAVAGYDIQKLLTTKIQHITSKSNYSLTFLAKRHDNYAITQPCLNNIQVYPQGFDKTQHNPTYFRQGQSTKDNSKLITLNSSLIKLITQNSKLITHIVGLKR